MLVSFTLRNHACFRDRAELRLEATGSARHDDRFTFDSGSRRHPRLSRATAIYGPNGSGKSRLIQGLSFARHFVIESAKGGQIGDPTPHLPFLLDQESRGQPTTYETSFIQDGTAYEFGFSVDSRQVCDEWLFAWPPGGRRRKLLKRQSQVAEANGSWFFGASVHGPKQTWCAMTRPNALLVTTASQFNSAVFRPVVDWFQNLQVLAGDDLSAISTVRKAQASAASRQRILLFLRDAQVAVAGLSFEERRIPPGRMRQILPPVLLNRIAATGRTGGHEWRIRLAHDLPGTDRKQHFDLEQESDGTRRLFALAGSWLEALDRNQTVVIDELDRSLHPHLVASLVRRINSAPVGDDRRTQLVMTAHDVTLLRDVLDRSQVWLTEKDPTEAARLVPLSDFRPRRNESLLRGYLGGRYGGVPVVTETDSSR